MVMPSLCRTLLFSMCLHQAQKSLWRFLISTKQDPEERDLILKLALLCLKQGLDLMTSRDSFTFMFFCMTIKSSLDGRGGAKNPLSETRVNCAAKRGMSAWQHKLCDGRFHFHP